MRLASVLAGILWAAVLTTAVRGQTPRTVWDGVYTEEQAKRGEALYMERCVHCHGTNLAGAVDGAASLTGATFNGNWNGVPLGQMVDRMRATMPLDKPNTLTRQQTADVLTAEEILDLIAYLESAGQRRYRAFQR